MAYYVYQNWIQFSFMNQKTYLTETKYFISENQHQKLMIIFHVKFQTTESSPVEDDVNRTTVTNSMSSPESPEISHPQQAKGGAQFYLFVLTGSYH